MNRSIRTHLLLLGLTLLLACSITTPAAAQGLVTGDTVPAGTVLDHDAILIGQNVTIAGTVNGNVFVLSNQVTVNGMVDGSLILIAQNASISGTVSGGVYAAALTLDLASHATIARDLDILTVSLTSGDQSIIGRDLYAIGLDSGLNGKVGRNLHTVIGPIQLYNGLMTLLGYDDLTIRLHFETPQPSTSPSGSLPPAGRHARMQIAPPSNASNFDWGNWALNLLRNWAVLFAFSLLALWLLRKPLDRSGEPLHSHPWRTLGTGFVALVTTLLLIGAGLLLAVLVFSIGLGLNFLGLWQLSLALWVTAYALLALALAALWFFIAYGTKIIVIYISVTWLSGRIFHQNEFWLKFLAMLAGTAVYVLLRSAPYVGWVFDVLFTAAGLGAAWMAYHDWRMKAEPLPMVKNVKTDESAPAPRLKPKKVSAKAG